MLFFFPITSALGQAKIITQEVIDSWKEVGRAGVDLGGNFTYYQYFDGIENKVVVKSLKKQWSFEFAGNNPYLTRNGYFVVFENGNGCISFFNVKLKKVTRILTANSINSSKQKFHDYLIFHKDISGLVIWNSNKNQFVNFPNGIGSYIFDKNNKITLLEKIGDQYYLKVLSVSLKDSLTIWNGKSKPYGITLAQDGRTLAFKIRESSFQPNSCQLFLSRNFNIAKEVTLSANQTKNGFFIFDNFLQFNKTGSCLLFSLLKRNDMTVNETLPIVEVWHYKDTELPTQKSEKIVRNNFSEDQYYSYCLSDSCKSILLQSLDSINIDVQLFSNSENFLLYYKSMQVPTELQLNPTDESKKKIVLRNLKTGFDITVADYGYYIDISSSPSNRYIVYFDQISKIYKLFNINVGTNVGLSGTIPYPIYDVKKDRENPPLAQPEGIAGWSRDDEELFIYDQFDIWRINPQNIVNPVCITGNVGRNNNAQIRFFNIRSDDSDIHDNIQSKLLIIKYLDDFSTGFSFLNLRQKSKLVLPSKKRFNFSEVISMGKFYMALMSNSTMAPNWFLSTDLDKFRQLTYVNPQAGLNWHRKQLVEYQNQVGEWLKGVLYFPDNFDISKKYPVIFHVYENFSDKIFEFKAPSLSDGAIDPAWMCSRGYLIFEPDIQFKFGKPGESALNSLLAGADYLKSFKWIDSSKFALSGVSHGAFSINYVLTKTNRFAAAASSAGIVDLISGYNSIRGGGMSRQFVYETMQGRMGKKLWDMKNEYLQNSAVLNAEAVNTPNLIMHNKADSSVPWSQGLSWFLSLRRLGKTAWLLQYDGEGHGLSEKKNQLDYTLRLEQFFDHYLKKLAAPKWMLDGLSSRLKGNELGYELDSTGRAPE